LFCWTAIACDSLKIRSAQKAVSRFAKFP